MIKYLFPDVCGVLQDNNTPIQRTQGVTKWSENENYAMALTVTRFQPNLEILDNVLDCALHHHHQNSK